MSNVLVVGGAGFIGSHLCERLASKHEVVSLDNYLTGSENNHVSGVKYIRASSSEIGMIPSPNVVYHLGEYSRVLTSFEDIEQVVESEQGTLAVLEYCRKNKVRLVYAGSSTKFGDVESPYSWFKAQNTELVKKYGEWFGLDYVIAYFYNVYGGREITEGKFATLIGKLTAGDIVVNGDGTQRRNFTHIEDIIDGLALVGEKGQGEYQIGSEEDFSVKEAAELFGRRLIFGSAKRGDRTHSKLDLSRMKELGWETKRSLIDYAKARR